MSQSPDRSLLNSAQSSNRLLRGGANPGQDEAGTSTHDREARRIIDQCWRYMQAAYPRNLSSGRDVENNTAVDDIFKRVKD